MSSYAFNYSFNITGNCDVVVQGITQGVKDLNDKIHKSVGLWDSFEGKLLALNQFTQYIEGVGRTMQETLQPGAALNASLADLSAISGETGESLRTKATPAIRQRRSAVRRRNPSSRTNSCCRSSRPNWRSTPRRSKRWATISPF